MKCVTTLILVLLFPCVTFGGSVTFNWTAPTVNCDGSPLDDLFGYSIMWGASPGGPYDHRHDVDDPGATSATLNVGSVEDVTLYFVAVSVDTSGNRSNDSGGCGESNEVAVFFSSVAPSPPIGLTGEQIP